MSEKRFDTRIINKHDYAINWLKAGDFIPKKGEFIIYDAEVDKDGNILQLPDGTPAFPKGGNLNGRYNPLTQPKIKIGDGVTNVIELPFSTPFIWAGDREDSLILGERYSDIICNGEDAVAMGHFSEASGHYALALGNHQKALGEGSFAQGIPMGVKDPETGETILIGNIASEGGAFAIGAANTAEGTFSMAQGSLTQSKGWASHSEGRETIASGLTSHSEGYLSEASGQWSHAEGRETKSLGSGSHAEGTGTQAIGAYCHSEGKDTIAGCKGYYYNYIDFANKKIYLTDTQTIPAVTTEDQTSDNIVCEYQAGDLACLSVELASFYELEIESVNQNCITFKNTLPFNTIYDFGFERTLNMYSVCVPEKPLIGKKSLASYAHTEGKNNIATGYNAHAEGVSTLAAGEGSHSSGNLTKAFGMFSHAEGFRTIARGQDAHAEGASTEAAGFHSHAEGMSTHAIADCTHAEGAETSASERWAHAEGYSTQASGETAHAEGNWTTAEGKYSHAEGDHSHAEGEASHTEGSGTYAIGDYSHAGGLGSEAHNKSSFAHGEGLITSRDNQAVFGKNNTPDGRALLIVGDGKNSEDSRHNAFAVYEDSIEFSDTKLTANEVIKTVPKFFSGADCDLDDDETTLIYTFNNPAINQIQLSKFYISYVDFSPGTGSNSAATLMVNSIEVNSKNYRLDVFNTEANIKPNGILWDVLYANGYIKFENRRAKLYINSWILYGGFEYSEPDYSLIFKDYEEGLYETEGWIYTSGDAVVVGRTSGYYVEDITELLPSDIAEGIINVTPGSTIKFYSSLPASEFYQDFGIYVQLPEFSVQYSGINQFIGMKGEGEWAEQFNAAELASGKYSHAEGYKTRAEGIGAHAEGAGVVTNADGSKTINPGGTAVGNGAHAEGSNTKALKEVSHAEGGGTLADGVGSHAEGISTEALGNGSHAEGGSTIAEGTGSHAEGGSTYAKGFRSHAEGDSTRALGNNTHAEGYYTYAEGNYSHSEGYVTRSIGNYSHTEGQNDLAFGETAHAEGRANIASGIGAHAEGGAGESFVTMRMIDSKVAELVDSSTTAFDWLKAGFRFYVKENEEQAGPVKRIYEVVFADRDTNYIEFNTHVNVNYELPFTGVFFSNHALGNFSHAEGSRTIAEGAQSHSEGQSTMAYGVSSHAEGNMTWAEGDNSHAEGWNTTAEGKYSHAEGRDTVAFSTGSHAEGYKARAEGYYSHAEGYNTYTSNTYSHAEGYETKALKENSHAEGKFSKASGAQAHAEGNNTQATGDNSHAEGWDTIASAQSTHASGRGTEARVAYQYVIGKFNDFNDNAAFIIGNGMPNRRSNLLEIGQNPSTKKSFIILQNEGLTKDEILDLWS